MARGKTNTGVPRPKLDFPPLPFSLELRIRIPTLSGDWDVELGKYLRVNVENPSPQLAEASSMTATLIFAKALLRRKVKTLKKTIGHVGAKAKQRLLMNPPADKDGNVIRMTKDNLEIWIMTESDYESALESLMEAEKLLEIVEDLVWEFKNHHKDLQILTEAVSRERSLERSTPSSFDPGRRETWKPRRPEPINLGDQLGDLPADDGDDD